MREITYIQAVNEALREEMERDATVFVMGEDEELRVVFDALANGAERERFQELHEMPFGTYGQFYDRYGVQWIFRGGAAPSRP